MYTYTAYGLGIHSTLPLPELKTSKTEADIVIRQEKLQLESPGTDDENPSCWAMNEDIYILWKGLGKCLMRNGEEIVIDSALEIEPRILRLFLLGGALPIVLSQRGLLVLHASAVEIDGQAVAFLGAKGSGKSTIAAMLHRRGHKFITDDTLAVEVSQHQQPLVFHSFGRFKLWCDSVTALGHKPELLPTISSVVHKRHLSVTDNILEQPIPLRCIYVLGQDKTLAIQPLSSSQGLLELIRHTYNTERFRKQVLQGTGIVRNFANCTKIIQQVPIRRLLRPLSLALLSDIAELVEKDGNSSS